MKHSPFTRYHWNVRPSNNGRTVEPSAVGSGNGTAHAKSEGAGIRALVEEAEAIKGLLRDAYTRTHNLLLAARRRKKQAQAVHAAMASLRQLQQVGA